MDVVSALLAHLQPPEAVQPRKGPFHGPPVAPQLLAGFDAPPGYPRGYAPLPQGLTASREIVSLVCVQLLGALARASTRTLDGLDGIHGLFQDPGVVDVGRRVNHRERDTSPVDHNMALRALFALIRRVRSGSFAPRGRGRSPSPTTPSASRSPRPYPTDPRASDAAPPTRPLLATP